MPSGLYRQLASELRAARCAIVRQGKGSHEIWQSPCGRTFTVPVTIRSRHLANEILKQAGLPKQF
ncbi:MAG: type II toxin-antitoxin system HicA family toxin [Alphaproteobacteria bacterium]